MGSTTTNGLPYPVGTDRVMDGDNAIQALAEAVDTKALLGGDTGNLTPAAAGFVPQSGFTNPGGVVRRRNGIVYVSLGITTTAAVGAGNIANTNMLTLPVGWRPPNTAALATTMAGPLLAIYAYGGFIILSATMEAMTSGYTFAFAGQWMV